MVTKMKKRFFALGFIFLLITTTIVIISSRNKSVNVLNEDFLPKNRTKINDSQEINQRKISSPKTTQISSNPNIILEEKYYQIYGNTPEELRQQMNQFGPNNFDGYTQWNITWNYNYQKQNNQCRITWAKVDTKIIITLPFWQPPSNVSPPLETRWNHYIDSLSFHENTHKNHGISASHDILNNLNKFPAYPSCNELEQEANLASHNIIKQYNQKDLLYDQQTNHGATEGAIFP
jgi:predicted secreted Zn-dependent protease